jgi:signal transduction histidine kinase
MAKTTSQPILLSGLAVTGLPATLRDCAPALFWLVLGLGASYLYLLASALPSPYTFNLPVPLFPPQAIILAVLLLTPKRHWGVYLLAYYALQVTQGAWRGLPLSYALLSNGANVAEPLVGALLVRRFLPMPLRFTHLQEVGIYVASVVAASTIGATWGASARAIAGYAFWPSWQGWFLADVLASLMLAPTILLWVGNGFPRLEAYSRRQLGEAALMLGGLLVVERVVLGTRIAEPGIAPALFCAPVPWLLWAAVRFGPLGLMSTLSLVTVFAITAAATGLGPFSGGSVPTDVFNIQSFLFAIGLPLFFLSAIVRENREARRGLAQSEERYRAVVRNLPHGAVFLFGPDLRHVFADGPALAAVGLSKETVEGKRLWETFPADMAEALTRPYEGTLLGAHATVDVVHGGHTYQAQVLPVQDAGHASGMMVLQDVTEERRVRMLTELDQAKTAFFSNVSHEFRTPLTLLLGTLDHLSMHSGDVATMTREQLETARRNCLRLLKLVNSLLDLTRLEAGRLQARYTPTDLARFTAELASVFRSAIERAGLRLVVDCPPLPEPIYVDRDQWEQIVINLLSNALKFTFSGEITVTLRVEHAQVVLTVRDTGTGILPEELPHLFKRFHRVRGARARTNEGTGIGLTLVQELARLHGGTVHVASTVGQGSTFTVAIPRGKAHLLADRIAPAADATPSASVTPYVEEARCWRPEDQGVQECLDARGGNGAGVPPPPPHAAWAGTRQRPARLLVVDDNADMRDYLVHLLESHGTIRTVGDGSTALQIARDWEPDLILADIMMPGLDGFALLAALRADPRLRPVPVVLLSARAGDRVRAEGLQAGADDYLVKPFAAEELLARVDGQLGLVHLRSEARASAERRRLAHDLHDTVAQTLYGLVLVADAARRSVRDEQRALAEERLERIGAMAREALRETRLLIHHLRPAPLAEMGLVRALEQRLNAVERRAGITAHLIVDGDVVLPPDAEDAFYYIAQEALTNVFKHAAASELQLRITATSDGTTLVVADNGRGFDSADVIAGGGLGLASMRQHADRIGASIAIAPGNQGGTSVVARLPVDGRRPVAAPAEAKRREDV